VLLTTTSACGRSPQPAVAPAAGNPVAAPSSEVAVIVTTEEAMVVQDLLLRAERRLESGQLDLAARDFELLLAAPHRPLLEARVRLGYALSLEGRGDLAAAANQLELRLPLVEREQLDAARLELVRRWLLLERFAAARALAGLIDHDAARSDDALLLHASDALGLVELGDADGADAVLVPAWSALEDKADKGASAQSFAAALVAFAAGEVAALRAGEVGFDPVPEDVQATLEERCRHMVAAQSAYADAMRLDRSQVRLLAGARIAKLYRELHAELLAAPLPAAFAAADKRRLAEGAIVLRYRVLLEKAEQMLRITLSGTPPSRATEPRRQELEATLAAVSQERAANAQLLEGLPVAASELERVLATLGPTFESATAGPRAAP
jgi:hypothetical protein